VRWSIASVGLVNPSLNECQGDNASFDLKGKEKGKKEKKRDERFD
jgi:hypothetical protein